MRTFFWTCTLALFVAPLVVAQDLEQLRKIIDANIPSVKLDDLGHKPPSPEMVDAGKAVVDAATKIYALPNLAATDLQWTLQREAVALMVLAHAEPATYYNRLTLISDELEKRGLPKLVKEAEKHVLIIGGELATKTGNNAINLNIESLAERMVLYAQQYPGQDSLQVIDHFLHRVRAMTNAMHRDRRLGVVAPIFQQFYKNINYSAKAEALDTDILRATLPGQPMFMMGVDINGKDLDLPSLKDKVVLLQFWGTWCVHCNEEIPNLIALYEKYHTVGFEIIGVNTGVKGDDEKKVKQVLNTKLFGGKKIPWTVLHEGLGLSKNNTTMTKIYGIEELPVLILVGRNGKVLNLHPLPATLDELIAEATSIHATVEFTEEEKKLHEEAKRKQQEAIDEQIRKELSQPK